MKKLKHFIIYILGVLLCLVITELLLSLAVKFIYSADNTFTQYVEKADKLLFLEEAKTDNISGILYLRSLLSDIRINGLEAKMSALSLTDTTVDISVSFGCRDRVSELQDGIFVPVVENDSDDILPLKDTVGLVKIDNDVLFCGDKRHFLLYPNDKIKLLKYYKDNYIVTPLEYCITNDRNTSEIEVSSTCNIDEGIIVSDIVYVNNAYDKDDIFLNADNSIYEKLCLLSQMPRKVDIRTEEMISNADYDDKGKSISKTKYGVGKFTIEQFAISQSGEYSMAYASQYDFHSSFVIYSLILIFIWSIINILVWVLIANKAKQAL